MWRLGCLSFVLVAGCGGIVGSVGPGGLDSGGGSDARGASDVALDGQLPSPDAGTRPCTTDPDCPSGLACAFSAALACGWNSERCATGTCTAPLKPTGCGAVTTVQACGCDGKAVEWTGGCGALFPEGLAPVPFAHLGPCASNKPCSTSAECGGGQACLFPAGAGCSAQGQCVTAGACNCDNLCCNSTPATACDGTPVRVDCQGFSTKPVCPGHCG